MLCITDTYLVDFSRICSISLCSTIWLLDISTNSVRRSSRRSLRTLIGILSKHWRTRKIFRGRRRFSTTSNCCRLSQRVKSKWVRSCRWWSLGRFITLAILSFRVVNCLGKALDQGTSCVLVKACVGCWLCFKTFFGVLWRPLNPALFRAMTRMDCWKPWPRVSEIIGKQSVLMAQVLILLRTSMSWGLWTISSGKGWRVVCWWCWSSSSWSLRMCSKVSLLKYWKGWWSRYCNLSMFVLLTYLVLRELNGLIIFGNCGARAGEGMSKKGMIGSLLSLIIFLIKSMGLLSVGIQLKRPWVIPWEACVTLITICNWPAFANLGTIHEYMFVQQAMML